MSHKQLESCPISNDVIVDLFGATLHLFPRLWVRNLFRHAQQAVDLFIGEDHTLSFDHLDLFENALT
ncbi:hypothetical protein BIZ53_30465 [Achromobacter xylosoxidans]|nr:hypothetical protein BIZ53_30465 [Achromobacter xylosoxidans]